ncbi:STAS/SEC14 domain-containing protein [Rufibacter latericius]|uniref:STAS/SEC14 domain-containing protein n=1 Tax=Rufibacter latericius TaxID=2487040 RepID=A0A3M9MM09_9BACT|nr:STAS/SEC14 domain-containing protein [Rufibacter latericius]RNI25923.1 STAS/SEC14 domain-containing protein [Rufibacter latericius]
MTKELVNPFGRVYLTIEEDSKNRLIYVNWMGYLTEENVKTGAKAYTQALAEAGFNCVLNDTRLIIGSWDHSMDWVLNDWAPNAAKAGLKRFAMLANPESFGESSASTFLKELKSFDAKSFANLDKAKQWLREFYKD